MLRVAELPYRSFQIIGAVVLFRARSRFCACHGREFDFPLFWIRILAKEDRHISYQHDELTLRLFCESWRQFLLLSFQFSELYLDQFVMIQGFIDALEKSRAQSVLAHFA
jgi:hypothetical protein